MAEDGLLQNFLFFVTTVYVCFRMGRGEYFPKSFIRNVINSAEKGLSKED